MKKVIVLLAVLLLAWLLFWPVPIEPVAWEAPEAPALEGPFAVNEKLADVEVLARDVGIGPEDVAIDDAGNLYVGYEDGRLMKFGPQGTNPTLLADTGGRPLGLDFDPDGNLIVADGYSGLVRVTPGGHMEILATEADGVPFRFTDDVDVASDGGIYFTDASSKFGPKLKARDDVLEHGGHGRLLRYLPDSDRTEVLLDGLQFANGVAMCPSEDCVLVAETGSYRVLRYWLKGDKAGESEVFADNLPGIPDGISSNGRDTYWVALFAPRNAALDALAPWPFLREMAFRLPQAVQPQPAPHAFVLGLSLDGEPVHNLQHLGKESFHPITSVEQVGNRLYLGSLTQPAFAVYELEENTEEASQ